MTPSQENISREKLVELRKKKGKTQEDVAGRIKMTRSSLSKKETGEYSFKLEEVIEYLKCLDMELLVVENIEEKIIRYQIVK